MRNPYCPTCQSVTKAIAYPTDGTPDGINEAGIVIDPDGSVSNFYGDGTKGVTEQDSMLADMEDTVYCAQHGTECEWVDALLTPEGAWRYLGQDSTTEAL
jgi:hypothetical protein